VVIYPNPTTEILNLDAFIPGESNLEMRVFNSYGKTVFVSPSSYHKSGGSYTHHVNVKGLIPGNYILEVKSDYGVIQKKFTVIK